jgi:decaprenyl-phosphate phosphoribosyltransferase
MDSFQLVNKYTTKNILYFKNILKLIRIKHYVKNILIFIPLVFSLNFTNISLFFKELLAFISFSFAASFVYVINDIVDREKDRLHPIKRNRPIASGAVSIYQGIGTAVILVFISFSTAFILDTKALFIVTAYLISNILYSFWLKNVPIIDVSILALGFLLRVLMGGAAISVPISKWLLLTIMTLSFYLGFAKRRNEMSKVSSTNETRKVLKEYNMNFLDKAMNSMMTLSIAFYALWSIDEQVVKTFNSDKLIITVPFVLIGMFRYSLIVEGDSFGDPTDIILTDRLLQLIIIGYIALVLVLIYI